MPCLTPTFVENAKQPLASVNGFLVKLSLSLVLQSAAECGAFVWRKNNVYKALPSRLSFPFYNL